MVRSFITVALMGGAVASFVFASSWRNSGWLPLHETRLSDSSIDAVAMSPDGSVVAVGTSDGVLVLYDAAAHRESKPMLFQLRVAMPHSGECHQRAGRVVGFRHAAGEIGPGPAARG